MAMPPNPQLPLVGQVLLTLLVLIAAGYDIRFRRIPNWLVLAGLVVGLTSTGFALYFPLYLLRARGAGDVKLLAAAGSIAGPGDCLWLFLLTAILGGLVALILILLKGRAQKTLFNVAWILRDLIRLRAPWKSSEELDVNSPKALRLPHGVLIAVGTTALIGMAQLHRGL
ncbi:MAG: pilus assembly protein CpaA [Acidobacteriia bacterium]|nr:pilus assembly protein CpaA [Terriglobia bacterium]